MIKAAIMIDGSFFLKRYRAIEIQKAKAKNIHFDIYDSKKTADDLFTIALAHINKNTLNNPKKQNQFIEECELYRIFYYDAFPISKKYHHPLTKRLIDYSRSSEYSFRIDFYNELKKKRKFALRLGYLKEHGKWKIKTDVLMKLLNGQSSLSDLTESDISLDLIQKGVDIRIGVDIASLAYKKLVNRIILISGDGDFVPAAKTARREGIDFILDSMYAHIDDSLFEHIDGLQSVWK